MSTVRSLSSDHIIDEHDYQLSAIQKVNREIYTLESQLIQLKKSLKNIENEIENQFYQEILKEFI